MMLNLPIQDNFLGVEVRPEVQLLLYCARLNINSATRTHIHALAQQPLNWSFLIQLAKVHGVLPLLYRNLNQTIPALVPHYLLTQLQQYFRANTQQNFLLTQELFRLLTLFEQHAIRVLPFKGIVLATTAYGHLSLRHITDLDLLVDPSAVESAKSLLLSQGYELRVNVPWEMHLIRPDQSYIYNVDLHSTIVPKHLSHPLQSQDIWQQVHLLTIGNRPIPNLSAEMTLLVLCLNGTKDGWRGLNRICDIAALIQTQALNWQIVMQQAQALRMQRLIGVGLQLASVLLELELPELVQQWLQRDRAIAKLTTDIQQILLTQLPIPLSEVARSLFHIRSRENLRDQYSSFVGLMEHSGWLTPTPEDRDFVTLPTQLEFLYYLIRPVRILKKYGIAKQKQLMIDHAALTLDDEP
jgi:hypothetical protein